MVSKCLEKEFMVIKCSILNKEFKVKMYLDNKKVLKCLDKESKDNICLDK